MFLMPGESAISLRFKRDNPCNTTIIDHDGILSGNLETRVLDGIGKLVAKWIWGDARSDLLTIGGRPQTRASTWLKRSFIPFREYDFFWLHALASSGDVKFLDDAGTEYSWQNNMPGLALQLHGPQSKTLPVARFIHTYRDYNADRKNPPVVPSTLLVDESVEPIRDFILASVSFLLLERRCRETETATVNCVDSLAVFGQSGGFSWACGHAVISHMWRNLPIQ
ncbi:hypothetical protein EDB83DRAFT_2553896 [Lactarius deliciosus]|nr:hypothetical protein EDB83DRAFT_2553896 [Lactarius deliciosus]